MTDDLETYVIQEELLTKISKLERQAIKSKTDITALKSQQKLAEQELEAAEKRIDFFTAASAATAPTWVSPGRPKKSECIAVAVLSDCHFDEVVNPVEVNNTNAYDREIAELRLERFVEKTIELARDYVAGVEVTGLVLLLGGDLVSGDIHEELVESNEGTMLETVSHWTGQLTGAINALADYFEKVTVASVVGNHGRRTRKPRMKKRVTDNFDWFLTHSVSQAFKDDARVTFIIPETAHVKIDVYNTTILLTHGDSISRGGGGIGGIYPVVFRGKARLMANPSTRHDLLVIGHYHQLLSAVESGLLVNGSLKGYDEYAAVSSFPYEEARQAFFLVTPTHGVTISAPIYVVSNKEKWLKNAKKG